MYSSRILFPTFNFWSQIDILSTKQGDSQIVTDQSSQASLINRILQEARQEVQQGFLGLLLQLRWSAYTFSGFECRGHVQILFCSWLFRSGSWIFDVFVAYNKMCNLPRVHMYSVIFSPFQFLSILLLEDMCPGICLGEALQQRVPGPRSKAVSKRHNVAEIQLLFTMVEQKQRQSFE